MNKRKITKLAKEHGYNTAEELIADKCPSEVGGIDDFEECGGCYEQKICTECWKKTELVSDDDVFRLTRKAFTTDEEYEEYLRRCEETETPEKPDPVNHPNHYQGAHECIEVMRHMFGDAAVRSFCKCNAFKYRFRADRKNGAEDIAKAEWYEDYLIKMDNEEYNSHIDY